MADTDLKDVVSGEESVYEKGCRKVGLDEEELCDFGMNMMDFKLILYNSDNAIRLKKRGIV